MRKDLTNLLEISYNRGFTIVTVSYENNNGYTYQRTGFEDLYVDNAGITILNKAKAIYIPFNNILEIEIEVD